MVDNTTLQSIVDLVVQVANPLSIVLFGSQARGQETQSSDIDLLVVSKQPFSSGKERRQLLVKITDALKDIPFEKDILIYSNQDVERFKDARNHVIGRAFREGRVLYG